jgi:hypothetical protein
MTRTSPLFPITSKVGLRQVKQAKEKKNKVGLRQVKLAKE